VYGESLLSGQNTDRGTPATDASDEPARPTRSGRAGVTEPKVDFGETSSEGEWDGGDENEPDEPDEVMDDLDEEEEARGGAEYDEEGDRSLVVTLRYGKGRSPSLQPTSAPSNVSKPAHSVEVVIPKPSPLSKMQTITPQSSAPNGYPTLTPTINGTNGAMQPSPRAPVTQSTSVLPPLSSVLAKNQAQLPFQPTPQHILKPVPHQQPPQPIPQHQSPQ
jgi:hypothetical protein